MIISKIKIKDNIKDEPSSAKIISKVVPLNTNLGYMLELNLRLANLKEL